MGRAKRLQNVHPGKVLVEEFLKPLGVTQYELAKRSFPTPPAPATPPAVSMRFGTT
jgi:hypothetical protein